MKRNGNQKRWMRLGTKMSLLIFGGLMILTAFLAVYTGMSMRSSYIGFYAERAQDTSRMIACLVDGDRLGAYLETGEKDDYYKELEKLLSRMKDESGAAYLYLFYPMEEQFIYLIDARGSGEDHSDIASLGDVYQYGEMEYRYLVPDIKEKKASREVILGADVGYGESVSAWAPVLDSRGNLAAMVEVDFFLEEVSEQVVSYGIRMSLFMLAGALLILLLLLSVTRRLIFRPMERLAGIFSSYEEGSFVIPDKPIETGDEMELLYGSFLSMVGKIDHYVEKITRITGEKERIGAELSIATQIQADLLPSIFPAFPDRRDMDIYALMDPAREVGGDFYDFFLIGESRLAVVIADVSGKGVPAALFMVIAKTLIKNQAGLISDVEGIFQRVNEQLCDGNKEAYFITAWLGILDLSTGEMEYVNAGHNPPLWLHGNGEQEWLRFVSGFVLAGMEGMEYEKGRLTMRPGDKLFLYTDGVTEAVNSQKELYGEERLLKILKESQKRTVQESVEAVRASVAAFAGEEEQYDDITMLSLLYNGKSEKE